jgi:hypothetical protein
MCRIKLTVPVAAIDLHSHADSAAMVAVRKKADPASPHRRIKFALGTQICVRIAFDHLQQTEKMTSIRITWENITFGLTVSRSYADTTERIPMGQPHLQLDRN